MTGREIQIGGVRLALAQVGEGQDFVFQHGLCGGAGQTADVFPLNIGWRCLTLECAGHGRSGPPAPGTCSIAGFAADVAAMIEAEAVGPCVVGGISMGAAIALRLAVIRPDLVRGLVLARPAWVDQAAPENMAANAEVGALLAAHPPEEARRRFEASATARQLAQEAPDNLASLRGFFSRQPLGVTADLLQRISADGPGVTVEDIRAIKAPTLAIGHARDHAHPLEYARRLAGLIPQARLAVITPKAESPERYRDDFRAALGAFLQELSP